MRALVMTLSFYGALEIVCVLLLLHGQIRVDRSLTPIVAN